MDYIIKNHKNLYIRLNNNGMPVTCTEHEKTLFEKSKAKNILDSLPRTLRRLNFRVEAVPDIILKTKNKSNITDKRVIENNNFVITDNISRWIEKFGICDDILKEAKKEGKNSIKNYQM